MRNHTKGYVILGNGNNRHVGDLFSFGGNSRQCRSESKLAVIKIGREGSRTRGIGNSSEGKLRVPPGKFAVAQASMQRNFVAGIFWNVQPIVNRVRGTG